jgi:hypothetical protein
MRQPARRPPEGDPPWAGGLAAATPGPARRIRTRPWVLAVAAVVPMAGVLAGGYAWSTSPNPADSSESRSLPGVVACAETIGVGDVTAVSRQGDRFVVTLGSVRYLKPADGPATFTTGDARLPIGTAGTAPVEGDRALVVVHDPGNVDIFTGADIDTEWAWMERALPDSRKIDRMGCA